MRFCKTQATLRTASNSDMVAPQTTRPQYVQNRAFRRDVKSETHRKWCILYGFCNGVEFAGLLSQWQMIPSFVTVCPSASFLIFRNAASKSAAGSYPRNLLTLYLEIMSQFASIAHAKYTRAI